MDKLKDYSGRPGVKWRDAKLSLDDSVERKNLRTSGGILLLFLFSLYREEEGTGDNYGASLEEKC